ncbi:MAG: hypothetical protein CMJ18_21915, partial [Phycisphaeraceae bacterium]|nr:hypothetical protein [Phycisphaeraceae bacterium]
MSETSWIDSSKRRAELLEAANRESSRGVAELGPPLRYPARVFRQSLAACAIGLAMVAAARAVPPEDFCANVRDYLPEDHVTDGSVDYREHIQRCFDENAQ